MLVETLDDGVVDVLGCKRLIITRVAALDHQRQLVLLEEALDRPWDGGSCRPISSGHNRWNRR